MKRLLYFLIIFSIVFNMVLFVKADTEPTVSNGVLSYNNISLKLSDVSFTASKASDLKIDAGIIGSGLYYKPVIIGDWIFLAGDIFIANDVDFDNTSSYNNQQVLMGTTYYCIFRFSKDLKTPQLQFHAKVIDNWGCPYDTTINEGDVDGMSGVSKGIYNWGKGRLIPQIIVSKFNPGTVYFSYEYFNASPGPNALVYEFTKLSTKDLEENNKVHDKQIFWYNPARAVEESVGFEEVDATSIAVHVFPKNYTGYSLHYLLDISVEDEINVKAYYKTLMPATKK